MEIPINTNNMHSTNEIPVPMAHPAPLSSSRNHDLKKYSLVFALVTVLCYAIMSWTAFSGFGLILVGITPIFALNVVATYLIAKFMKIEGRTWLKALFVNLSAVAVNSICVCIVFLLTKFTPYHIRLSLLTMFIQGITLFFAIRFAYQVSNRRSVIFLIWRILLVVVVTILGLGVFAASLGGMSF